MVRNKESVSLRTLLSSTRRAEVSQRMQPKWDNGVRFALLHVNMEVVAIR